MEWKYIPMSEYKSRVKKAGSYLKYGNYIDWMCAVYPENKDYLIEQYNKIQVDKYNYYHCQE